MPLSDSEASRPEASKRGGHGCAGDDDRTRRRSTADGGEAARRRRRSTLAFAGRGSGQRRRRSAAWCRVMELNALEQRDLEHGQFNVADDGDVSRVDHVAQRLRRTNAVLSAPTPQNVRRMCPCVPEIQSFEL